MDKQQTIYDIVIIGAGPVGLFGGFFAGLRGMRTLIIDTLPEMGGQLAALYPEKYIYDVPGFSKILAKDLVKNLVDQVLQFNPTVRLNEQVVNLGYVDETKKVLRLSTTKDDYCTKSILIAAGVGAFSPNKLDIPEISKFEDKGIAYFVQDKEIFRGKRLLIVGGGDSAVDWALSLVEVANKVTLIHRRDQFRAHETSVQQLRNAPVDVKLFYELQKVCGQERVESATIINNQTKETQELPVDAILINLGFRANLGPIKDWGISITKRAIQVDANYGTSMPGIYAAGSIADSPSKLDLIVVGFSQAAIAVNSAKAYIDPQASFNPGHSSSKEH